MASFMILIICPDWYLYSLLSIGVALYLLALGKSHTLNWENKDMSKNLYPPGLECVIFMTTQLISLLQANIILVVFQNFFALPSLALCHADGAVALPQPFPHS